MTPLRGPNRLVYAVAQGPIAGIPRGVSRADALPAEELANLPIGQRMVASVGTIPGGAIVEREINLNLNSRARLYMNLRSPDFTTAVVKSGERRFMYSLARLFKLRLISRSTMAPPGIVPTEATILWPIGRLANSSAGNASARLTPLGMPAIGP